MQIERLENEPLREFEIFMVFLELPEPNIQAAYRKYTRGKTSSRVYSWARKYDWHTRREQFLVSRLLQRMGAV